MLLLLPLASDAAPCRLNRLGGAGGVMKVPIIIWWENVIKSMDEEGEKEVRMSQGEDEGLHS